MNITERGHSRIALRRAVRLECQAVRERDFRLLGVRAVDLSPFGMRLVTDGGADVRAPADVRLGDEVMVTFRAPGSYRWIDCAARVSGIFVGSLGLSFGDMGEASRTLLATTLRGLPPPIPPQAPPSRGSMRGSSRAANGGAS